MAQAKIEALVGALARQTTIVEAINHRVGLIGIHLAPRHHHAIETTAAEDETTTDVQFHLAMDDEATLIAMTLEDEADHKLLHTAEIRDHEAQF